MGLLSQRAYARHRGVTLKAVQKAIAARRITLVVEQGTGKLKIDPAIADAQWIRNTDVDQQIRGNGGVLPAQPGLPIDGAAVQTPALPPAGGDETTDREELLRHRIESAELENERKRIELARQRGEVVSLAEEREVRTKRYRSIREKFLGLPDREAAALAAELRVDPVQLRAVLIRVIEKALHELSDDAAREAARGIAEPMAA